MIIPKKAGSIPEYIASIFLKIKGYKILEKQFRTKFAEVDIIAKKRNIIVFVEVKYRKTNQLSFFPFTQKQLNRVRAAANVYLSLNHYDNHDIRFDIIYLNKFRIQHLTNAF